MSEGLLKAKSAPLPDNPFGEQFTVWADVVGAKRSAAEQHPVDELLAEHHFLRLVFQAMQIEASRTAASKMMNVDFWALAVDVVGNFGLLTHWRKKTNHLFPRIEPLGFEDRLEKLDLEQQRGIEITLDVVDAVQEGDAEKVVRLVSLFLDSRRRQMKREEDEVLLPARAVLSEPHVAELREEFDEAEANAIPPDPRRHYYEAATKLWEIAGLEVEAPAVS